MPTLQERIESALRQAIPTNNGRDVEKLISYLRSNEYFGKAKCHSHNNWDGGLAEHSWITFQCALSWRNTWASFDMSYLDLVSEEDLAIVCLLHDICDTYRYIRSSHKKDRIKEGHGTMSVSIISDFIGIRLTSPQYFAIMDHQHGQSNHKTLKTRTEKWRYRKILELQQKADHNASGVAWNRENYKGLVPQHYKQSVDDSALRIVALDRTCQMLDYRRYCDYNMDFQEIDLGYGLNKKPKFYSSPLKPRSKFMPYTEEIHVAKGDVFEYARNLALNKGYAAICLTGNREFSGEGVNVEGSNLTRRHSRRGNEKELFICSDISRRFYNVQRCEHFTYSLSPLPEIQSHYPLDKNHGGIYIPGVTFIRDGEQTGFQQVPPYIGSVIIVPGKHVYHEFTNTIEQQIRNNITTMLRIAVSQGQQNLVIPAYGADGSWHNPQEEIVRIFKEILCSDEFDGAFSEIHFVCPNDEIMQIYAPLENK